MASKWRKRLKKLGKNLSKVLKPAAVVAALAIPGVGGLAAASVLGVSGAALTPGNRKKKLKSLKRVGINVGGALVGKGALGLISGQGVGASVLSSAPKIFSDVFGGGSALPGAKAPSKSGTSGLDEAGIAGWEQAGSGGIDAGAGGFGAGAAGFLGSMFSGAQTSTTTNPNESGERGGGAFGGYFGGEEPPGGKGGINPLWIVGGGLALLVLSKKKAG